MYWTYVLHSIKFERMYIGHTGNLDGRIKEHNSGKTKSTKGFTPWELVYSEMYDTRKKAIQREKELKSGFNRE